MHRSSKIYLLILLLVSIISYAENTNKLKAEIEQKENKIHIKISKDNDSQNEKKIIKRTKKIHLIKKGDTLSKIALKYKKNIHKIAKENSIKNIDLIIAGKNLIIEQGEL